MDTDSQLTALTRLAELGVGGISASEMLSELVLYVLPDVQARFATLGHLDMHSFVTIVGSYGTDPRSLASVHRASLWTPTPLTDAIRLDRPIQFTRQEGIDRYPQWFTIGIAGDRGIALPVRHRGGVIGALFVTFESAGDVLGHSHFWSAVAAMCLPHVVQHSDAVNIAPDGESPQQPPFLDERQLTVLRYLAQDKTNAQIAHCMGYGKSTIGHLTMEIYKVLNVKTRGAAVHAAGQRGLLPSPAPVPVAGADQRNVVKHA